ncbi:MAG: hypothetical protein ACT4P6_05060 [Gemmatimonadaceae bacterium]
MYRRHFVAWLVALAALPKAARAAGRRVLRGNARQGTIPSQAATRALGEALLPSELGKAKTEIASDAFWRWMSGYREGAELLHPYGSARISYAGPSPVPTWAKQVAELDRAARAKHRAAFAALSTSNRTELVREALAAFPTARLDDDAAAPHVALGLLAHFYGSSEATDLCYRSHIGRNKCRPLVHNGRKPLPITSP